jgi:hypothetical protein
VEDPTAQITDLNISSLKESPDITAQSLFWIKGKYHESLLVFFFQEAPPLRLTFLCATLPIKLPEIGSSES